jgi:hypothetical protein
MTESSIPSSKAGRPHKVPHRASASSLFQLIQRRNPLLDHFREPIHFRRLISRSAKRIADLPWRQPRQQPSDPFCGDQDFVEQLRSKLLQETLELKEAQSSEPDGLVLQAIVENVFPIGFEAQFHNIRFNELADSIWKNHRVSLSPRQIGRLPANLDSRQRSRMA